MYPKTLKTAPGFRPGRLILMVSFLLTMLAFASVTYAAPLGPEVTAAPRAPQAPLAPTALTFVNRTTTDGLGADSANDVYAAAGKIYVATYGGLSISTNGGVTFTNRTTADGLGDDDVRSVYAEGSTVYAATYGGLSISTNGGVTFTNRTTADGLGEDDVSGVYAEGSTVYAAMMDGGGLGISTNGGVTFTNRTTADGLGDDYIRNVYAAGSTVYAATMTGLSISTDGGASFTNRTTAEGLGDDHIWNVYAEGSTVYAATSGGLSISTDGGASFTNRTTADGLGNNEVFDVYVAGSTVYAATGNGLSVSTDGGATFTHNYTTTAGLGYEIVRGVYVAGSTVYAATPGGLSIGTENVPAGPIAVTTTDDEFITDGDCSLREAIQAANTNAAVDACPAGVAGLDTITLPAGTYTLTIAGAGDDLNLLGDYDILEDLTINGAGADVTIVDGAGLDRLFHIPNGSNAAVTLNGLTVQHGAADMGGGIMVFGGRLTLNNSLVFSNTATASGGGIYNISHLTVTASAIIGNVGNYGGGIGDDNAMKSGAATLLNTTISGNRSTNQGGGVYLSFSRILTLSHCTVSDNHAGGNGGGIYQGNGPVGLEHTLVAGNTAGGNGAEVYVSNAHTNHGYNLFGHSGLTTTRAIVGFTPVISDIVSTSDGSDPTALADILSPLADNGGGTPTHALPAGSPAIDAAPTGPATDQRGIARPQGASYDIGAYEAEPTAPTTPICFATHNDGTTVFSSSDSQAVRDAIAASPGGMVKIAGTCAGVDNGVLATVGTTLTLMGGFTTTEWMFSNIDAYPTILDAQGNGRVVQVNALAMLWGLTLRNGNAAGGGGGVNADANLTMWDITMISNTATGAGGAVFMADGKTLDIASSTFEGNTSGAYCGAIRSNGPLSLHGTTFTANRAAEGGGAVCADSGLTGNDLTFTANRASSRGGALLLGGPTTLTTSDFISNTTTGYGGGIFADTTAPLTLTHANFISNTVAGGGAGIYVRWRAVVIDSLFQANTANNSQAGGGAYIYWAPEIRNTQFLSNTVLGDGGAGGGLCVDYGDNLTDVVIQGNTAAWGGGLYGTDLILTRGTVAHNTATVGSAGGLYLEGNLAMTDTQVLNNIAALYNGGARVEGAAAVAGGVIQGNTCAAANCFSSGMRVSNTLTITLGSGYTFNDNLNVFSDLVNNGVVTVTSGIVTLDKSYHAQTIGGTNPSVFGGLVVSNTHGVELEQEATVTNILTLTTDLTVTTGNTLHLGADATTAGAGDVWGVTRRESFANGTAYAFGNPDVTITFDSGAAPTAVAVDLQPGTPAGLADAVTRGYTVTATGGSGYAATLRLRYKDAELNGADEASLGLWRYDGAQWGWQGQSAANATTNWVEQSGITAFSPWAIAEGSVTPPPAACFATLDATTVYSSADASAVQQAVDAASAGDTVKIAGTCAGVQVRYGTTQTVHISTTLTLAGGYTTTNWTTADPLAHPTILDAENNGRVVYAAVPVTVTDLTLQHGNFAAMRGGGGALFENAAKVLGVTFISNTAAAGGGAVFKGPAYVASATFISNTAAIGGGAYFGGAASVTGTTFISNTAHGMDTLSAGGGATFVGAASMTNTTFISNTADGPGGGAYFTGAADVTGATFADNRASSIGGVMFMGPAVMTDATFRHNTAIEGVGGAYFVDIARVTDAIFTRNAGGPMGGGVALVGESQFTNVLFADNIAADGAALYHFSTSPLTLTHVTIAGASTVNGAALYLEQAAPVTLTNSIIVSHTIGIQNAGSAVVNSDYNLFYNAPTTITLGAHSITGTNPLFVDPANGDYHLGAGSPAIDAGVDMGVLTDLDGAVRPQGAHADMGAYEALAGPAAYSLTIHKVGNGSVRKQPDQATYPAGSVVTLTAVPSATYTFTGWSGDASGTTDTITVTMDADKSVTATFTLSVTIPEAPVVTTPISGTTLADATPTFVGTGEAGATVTVTLQPTGTLLCSATVAADGSWSCAPTTSLPLGTHAIAVTQTDPAGNTSAPTLVVITLAAPNQPPVAQDDAFTTPENVPAQPFNVLEVLLNDTDPETDTLTLVAVSLPAHGTAAISGTVIVYTPTTGYLGTDVFTYTVSDGQLSATARVTVTVWPVADLAVTQRIKATLGGYELTLVARNLGPRAAGGAVVSDTFPVGLGTVTWACSAAGGAVCPSASGSGAVAATLATFPVNGVVTYTVSAVSAENTVMWNTVTITAPAGMFDLNPANNQSVHPTQYRIIFPIFFRNYTP